MVAAAKATGVGSFANAPSAGGQASSSPRWALRRNDAPNIEAAAVAPNATSTRGATAASSAANQGWQAWLWAAEGFSWIRRVLRSVLFHRKCFTALVREI